MSRALRYDQESMAFKGMLVHGVSVGILSRAGAASGKGGGNYVQVLGDVDQSVDGEQPHESSKLEHFGGLYWLQFQYTREINKEYT